MARRLIPKIERFLRRGEDVRGRLRELQSIKDHAITEQNFFGR
jgi:hypothetical protein